MIEDVITMTFIHCFIFFWAIFSLLVPYPLPSGSTTPLKSIHAVSQCVTIPAFFVDMFTGLFLNRFWWAVVACLGSTPVSFSFLYIFFGELECVCRSFANVTHFVF
jgi:hypothetical protein